MCTLDIWMKTALHDQWNGVVEKEDEWMTEGNSNIILN